MKNKNHKQKDKPFIKKKKKKKQSAGQKIKQTFLQ